MKGDLRILRNSELCKLICKARKFRETKPINFYEAEKNVLKGKDCIPTSYGRKALPAAELISWRESISLELDRMIDVLQKESYRNNGTLLQNSAIKHILTESHEKYGYLLK